MAWSGNGTAVPDLDVVVCGPVRAGNGLPPPDGPVPAVEQHLHLQDLGIRNGAGVGTKLPLGSALYGNIFWHLTGAELGQDGFGSAVSTIVGGCSC